MQKNTNVTNMPNNTFIQNNYFNYRSYDIYNIKKVLHCKDYVLKYVSSLIENKNPNNKHDWIKDEEIFDQNKNVQFKLIFGPKRNDIRNISFGESRKNYT